MAETIYLHIGTHKTGTSAIQRFMSANAPELAKIGLFYPSLARPSVAREGHHLLAWLSNHRKRHRVPAGSNSLWRDVLAEIDASGCNTAVISAEDFESLDATEVAHVRAQMPGRRVKIVLYLRNPAALMVSSYNQRVKSNKTTSTFSSFVREHISKCNYAALVSRWKSVFGSENVIVRLYDAVESGDVVTDFVRTIGFDGVHEVAAKESNRRTNRSVEINKLRLILLLNRAQAAMPTRLHPIVNQLRKRIRKSENRLFDINLPLLTRPLMTETDRTFLRHAVDEWNRQLFEHHIDEVNRRFLDVRAD